MDTLEKNDPRLIAAREAFRGLEERALRESPLADMPEWVTSGAAPPAVELRAVGFRGEAHEVGRCRLARPAFFRLWGFSIPCAEAVAALRGLGPLVEIGAGSGYWSALLRAAGHNIVATDALTEGDIGYGFQAASHAPLEPLSATEAVRRYPERDVFCSWPTKGDSWALGAAWTLDRGRSFALIGEPTGEVTGTRGLVHYLKTRFSVIAAVEIPQFPGCHDSLTIYRKL